MPCENSYVFTVPECFYDNETATRRFPFSVISCPDQETIPCSYYSDICDADTEYLNPVCEEFNKYLYFQLGFKDTINVWPRFVNGIYYPATPTTAWRLDPDQVDWLVAVEVYDICCNKISDGDIYITQSNVLQVEGISKQNVKIDTTNLPEFFQFRFFTPDGRETFSPPYQKICCPKLCKIRGLYNQGFNCGQKYIGLPSVKTTSNPLGPTVPSYLGDVFTYIEELTFIGECYKKNHSIEKTVNRNITQKGTYIESWQTWVERCPEYVANELGIILTAKTIQVYNPDLILEGNFNGTLDKNDSLSNMWTMEFELTSWKCDLSIKC